MFSNPHPPLLFPRPACLPEGTTHKLRVLRKTVQKQRKVEAKREAERAKLEKASGVERAKKDDTNFVHFLDHLRETEDYLLKLYIGDTTDTDTQEPLCGLARQTHWIS